MPETLNELAVDSLADSFETMAFLSPMPAEEPYEPPTDAVLLSVRFAGNSGGVVEMVAPRELGRAAASNMLGVDSPTETQNDDAMKELLNIFSGLMLRRWSSSSRQTVNLSLPQIHAFDVATWPEFVSTPGAKVMDVEGNIVALRVVTTDKGGQP
jgi:chemotaxis protein CheY-P-specific phosphatase CheC